MKLQGVLYLIYFHYLCFMVFTDTHIHLDAEDFHPDLAEVVERARAAEISTMLLPNVDTTTIEGVMQVCRQYQGSCFPMMGLHPTSVKEDHAQEMKQVEKMLQEHKFVAIGEIGIDLYWDKTYYHEQQLVFVHQMLLARDLHLPAVIHSRKSLEEILTIIKKDRLEDIPAVFHCFPGSVEQAKKVTGMGYKLGIGGVVTFKNAALAEVVKATSLKDIVLETDGPWLAPVPFRGKRNEPCYIRLIAEKVAELKEVSVEEVAEKTTLAAQELFSL